VTRTYFYLRDVATGGTSFLGNSAGDRPSAPTGSFTTSGWQ
jgi:hypothetical protein